jgi:hypothetical protein
VNYEDNKYDQMAVAQAQYLDKDNLPSNLNKIDFDDNDNDKKINIEGIDDQDQKDLDEKVKEDYLKKFRKEVDFHHKVAYRFEKAYRLGKKMSIKKAALNAEIISIISEHDAYIEQDPMALFYCIYFCIYYNNPEIVEFLKILVEKIENPPEKITDLLKSVQQNGISRLRTIGDPLN